MPKLVDKAGLLLERRRGAIERIAAGEHPDDVAKALNLNPTTIWRWRKSPEFQAAVLEHQATMCRGQLRTLSDLVSASFIELEFLLRSPKTNDSVKQKVAFRILGMAGVCRDNIVEARLRDAIERILGVVTTVAGDAIAKQVLTALRDSEGDNIVDGELPSI